MEQQTPRPSYLFIPKPIEKQLTAYQLGTLLEVYKRGWAEHDNRRPKFFMLIFSLVMLAIAAGSILIIFYSVQATHALVVGIIIIPFFAIIGLVVGVQMLFQASLCVGAFSGGFVYAKNTQVTVLTWQEIASFEQKMVKGMAGALYVFTIHAHDGRIVLVKAPYLQLDKLGKIIRKNIA